MRKLFGTGVAVLATVAVLGAASRCSPIRKKAETAAAPVANARDRRMTVRRRARAGAAPAISRNQEPKRADLGEEGPLAG